MDQLKNQISALISQKTKIPLRPFSITKLAGDASYRTYYRLKFEDNESLIIMKMPAGKSSVSEEVTKTTKKFDELPFINVQRYLDSLDIPVPKISAYAPKEGLLILEDLGDRTLEKTIGQTSGTLLIFFYEKAIDLLVKMQLKTSKDNNACMAFHRKFDKDLLLWEFNHFLEYGIEDRLKTKIKKEDKKIFNELGGNLVEELIKIPYGFVHRDFQSRNLMIHAYDFRIIDFQDALIGPIVYDLVSLLRDSYVELSENQLDELIKIYLSKIDSKHPYYKKEEKLIRDFDLTTIQRKLKDAGRFQYINTVKGNPNFLKNVPVSLKYVREALARQKKYGELAGMIAKYLGAPFIAKSRIKRSALLTEREGIL